MTTKYKIAEQVLLKLYGGAIDISNPVQIQDVIEAVNQEVNTMLKMQHLSVTLPAGQTIPENLMVATYDNVAVTSFGGKKAKAILPAMPISLPRNMGVYEVSDDEYFSNLFIPLQAGQANLVSSQPMISTLLGQTGYEVYGNSLIFTTDITVGGTEKVYIRLIILDISKYEDYDMLPIPSDYEGVIVDTLFKKFAPVQIAEKIVDSTNEPINTK